jgi:hypothetical protein
MNFLDLKNKWLALVDKMNKAGVPVPTVRDPKTGQGSITAALVVFSAGLFGLCIISMLASGIAKYAGMFVLTDATVAQIKMAADYSFQFLLASLGGYLGRYMQKGDVSLQQQVVQPTPPSPTPKPAPKVDSPD